MHKLLLAVVLSVSAHAFAHPSDTPPSQRVTTQLAVTGAVEHPLKLSVADLRQFPVQQIGEFPLAGQGGAKRTPLKNVKGVRLRDLLERATLVSRDHNDVKKMVIIATASDGYVAAFSWAEIFNSSLGDGVLVFYEQDGSPLADDEGRIAMISTQDTRSGPRHVKWLQSIEVRKIVD